MERVGRLGGWWLLLGLCCAGPAMALELVDCYRAALARDPESRMAEAMAEGGRELVPLARAQTLPSLSASATVSGNDLSSRSLDIFGRTQTEESRYRGYNYALTLRQPIYRPQLDANLRQAVARQGGVESSLRKSRQDLAMRVAENYLQVILAEAALAGARSRQAGIAQHLEAARRHFELGQGTRTDIIDVRARLELQAAREADARQEVERSRRELRELTGEEPGQLPDLMHFRPLPLEPATLDDWRSAARESSPELQDLAAQWQASRLEVEKADAGHRPTLDLVAQYLWSESDNITNPDARYINAQVGFQLVVPLYAGGQVSAQSRQAVAYRTAAEERLEAARRRLDSRLNQEFLAVVEGTSKLRALEQALASAEEAVRANRKSLQAGARTRLDVLDAESRRDDIQQELLRERARYIQARLRLHWLAGNLGGEALARVDQWLRPATTAGAVSQGLM